jgi:dTDP-4-dehydrorhamnose reductase
MRFGVLGAAGQLGSDLCPRLPGEVVPLSRAEIDLTWHEVVPEALAGLRLDVLINCAAYNFVDRAEAEPEAAFAVNAWGVRALARACRRAGVRLVHFSSDYVFGLDAERTTPLSEDDPPGPVNVYGLSKLAGEYLARAECPGALVIRTCGLYGTRGSGGKGGNFVETMLRLAREGKPIRVVNDQRLTPSYAVDVAAATVSLMGARAEGLHHVTNAGDCTWYEFAREIFERSALKPNLTSTTSAELGAAARRPAYSVLGSVKLGSPGLQPLRAWADALGAYLLEREGRRA